MSRSTISTFQLFAMFPDEDAARLYLEARIWPDGPVCPECHSGARDYRPRHIGLDTTAVTLR